MNWNGRSVKTITILLNWHNLVRMEHSVRLAWLADGGLARLLNFLAQASSSSQSGVVETMSLIYGQQKKSMPSIASIKWKEIHREGAAERIRIDSTWSWTKRHLNTILVNYLNVTNKKAAGSQHIKGTCHCFNRSSTSRGSWMQEEEVFCWIWSCCVFLQVIFIICTTKMMMKMACCGIVGHEEEEEEDDLLQIKT